LYKEAFLIDSKSAAGFTSELDGKIAVGLTTEMTPELISEGMVRDLIRHVQIMRKNANFAVEDRIIINGLIDGPLGNALEKYTEFFCSETLTIEMSGKVEKGEFESTFKINDQTLTLSIERKKYPERIKSG
jgi:isoleucyl-tRNA synthetase